MNWIHCKPCSGLEVSVLKECLLPPQHQQDLRIPAGCVPCGPHMLSITVAAMLPRFSWEGLTPADLHPYCKVLVMEPVQSKRKQTHPSTWGHFL